jgi:hypothetical protein
MSAPAADVPVPGVGRTNQVRHSARVVWFPHLRAAPKPQGRLDLLNANHFGNDADSLSGSPMAVTSTQ